MCLNYMVVGWVVYGALSLTGLTVSIQIIGGIASHHLIWPLGAIATWRYGWQAIHFARATLYRHFRFPVWRHRADAIAAHDEARVPQVLIVVTSYQISAEENFETYSALFCEAIAYGAPTTIVASVTDDGDARFIHEIFREHQPPNHIRLITQIQAGTGKRPAMAEALRSLARVQFAPDGVVILMDGDTVVTPDIFAKSFVFFRMMHDLGALTVNNDAEVRGSRLAVDWYAMRFALRTLYMSSLSLSRRVLCLTGRFSVFRAEVACAPEFISAIGEDSFQHWRLGRVPMLTGDDKSSWFHCLKNHWTMIYLPDVSVQCMEELPSGGFFRAAPKLMHRWFGNMLRNSDRAIALGPRTMGWFTWWCLVDQRLNMWTSITGPIFAVIFVLDGRPEAILAYITFVLISRFIQTLNVAYHGGRPSPLVPFLLLYQQFVGALLKIHVLFHLDRQKWTRQNIGTGGPAGHALLSQDGYGFLLEAMTLLVFVSAISVTVGMAAG